MSRERAEDLPSAERPAAPVCYTPHEPLACTGRQGAWPGRHAGSAVTLGDLVRGQPGRSAALGGSTRAVPARVHLPRPANTMLRYAVLAAAALHGGIEPDLLDEVAWWQTDDLWLYALFAAVAYIRAAASRAGVRVGQACQDLGQRPGHPAP